MIKCAKTRRAGCLLCYMIGASINFEPCFAESRVIDLGDPNEDAPIARIYEVGTYAYDPQASAQCVGTWGHAAGLTSDDIDIKNHVPIADKSPTGDLDGDGFDDLVLAGFFHSDRGVNLDFVDDQSMKWLKRGAVWLVFGGADFGGVDQYLDRDLGIGQDSLVSYSGPYLSNDDQMSRPFYLWGYRAIECADMNRDGFDDVVILARGTRPLPDPNGIDPTKPKFIWNLIIVYGGQDIRNRFIDLDDTDDRAKVTIIELPRVDHDAYEFSRFLRDISLAVADLNADGYPDIALGESWRDYPPDNSLGEIDLRGAVTILFGGTFPVGEIVSAAGSQFNSRVSRVFGVSPTSNFGSRLSTGDINGDGIDDLLVTYVDQTQDVSEGYLIDEGSLAVIYGEIGLQLQSGLLDELDFAVAPTKLVGISAKSFNSDTIASDIATGDTNADGFDDLIVGHVFGTDETVFDRSYCGRTTTIHGSPVLPGQKIFLRESQGENGELYTLGKTSPVPAVQNGGYMGTMQCLDYAGSSVNFADIDGDGKDDWLIWASQFINTYGPFVERNKYGFGRCYVLKAPVAETNNPIDLSISANIRVESAIYPGCDPDPYYFPSKWYRFPFTGGDLNRDGFAEYGNCSQFGRAPDRIDLTQPDVWGSFEIVMGQSTPGLSVAQAFERFKPGNAPSRGFGGRTSPVLRAHLSFADGDGPSPVTATLTRSNGGLANANVNAFAQVHWKLETTRANWTEARIRFQYTDAEINSLSENALKLFQASSKSGPWTEVPGQVHDQHRNEFTATVSALGYFALGDTRDLVSPSVTLATSAAPTVSGPIEIQVTLTEPVNTLATSDVSTINATVTDVTGNDTQYEFILTPINQGEFGAHIAAGSLEDAAGNPNKSSNTVSRTLDSVGPTVALSSTAPNVVGGEIVISALLNEATEDFTAADISADNAVVAAFTGSGKSYTFRLIPQSVGQFSAHINAAKCVDALENPNSASNTLERTFEQTSLRLLGPNGGESFAPNGNVTVTWQSSGNVGANVCIELWRRGELVKVLSKKTANDGTEIVTLPSKLAAKNGYSIRIYSMRNHGFADTSNKPFRVVAPS